MKQKAFPTKLKNLKLWQKLFLAVVCLILVILLLSGNSSGEAAHDPFGAGFQAAGYDQGGYMAYLAAHKDAGFNGASVELNVLGSPAGNSSSDLLWTEEYDGKKALGTSDEGSVSFDFRIEQEGLYAILVDYYSIEGYGSNIERNILIDGEYPFKEAEGVEFTRCYVDETPNASGGTLRPNQVEQHSWMEAYITDAMGYYAPALYFYLDKGAHTLTFQSVKEPMAIGAVTLVSEDLSPVSYAETKASWDAQGAKDVQGVLENGALIVQAENAFQKSSPTLYAMSDTTSTKNQPFSYTKKLLNVIGGEPWEFSNQWISWEVSVPESGYYKIGVRVKQDTAQDIYYNRSFYIDDQLPFLEAENIHFYYADDWQVFPLGTDDVEDGYSFYLEKGTHTLTFKNTLGDMVDILAEADSIQVSLADINLSLLAMMGTTPDTDRDYQIGYYMADTVAELKQDGDRLQAIYNAILGDSGERGSMTSQLEQLISVIGKMTDDPEQIPSQYGRFRDLIGTFGEWIISMREQPLTLDYLYLAEAGYEPDTAKDGFLDKVAAQCMSFVSSFTTSYSMISGDDGGNGEAVTVWIGSGLTGGRDQAMALNRMIQEEFTRDTGISVNLQLVPASTLKTATFAGRGPDIALQVDQVEPVDFALRGAACDLTQFEDFEEVAKRFSPNATEPFRYNGGVYALPETMSFPMLFYRTDIIEQLGIDISELSTWQGVIGILAVLQGQNMDFALPYTDAAGMQTYSMFLYQMGGEYYTADHTASALDEKLPLDAFEFWMDFYQQYGLATDYSFENRFRTGEMPIGIAEYTNYNLLSISAPEIKGKWAMTVLPGTVREDGTINNVAPITVQGCMMLDSSKNKEAAWEFMKWWTSADTQYEFGEQLEAVMGAAARYNTANLEALLRFSWTGNDRRSIETQISNLKGMPQVPGGYFTERNLRFARLAVINDNENAREALIEYSDDITEEITIKRREFGLDTAK